MVTITKRFSFCYAHSLPGYIGKCARVHGHNSKVEVEVSGSAIENNYSSMVMDFGRLKQIVNEVLAMVDHYYLNDLVIFPNFDPPTAENIVQWLALEIQNRLPDGVVLESVFMSETDNSWAVWRA